MAKASKKSSRKQPGKKASAKQRRSSKVITGETPAPPKQRARILKKISKIGPRPSRPTDVGPHLDLSYDAPVHPQDKKRTVARKKRAAKKRVK